MSAFHRLPPRIIGLLCALGIVGSAAMTGCFDPQMSDIATADRDVDGKSDDADADEDEDEDEDEVEVDACFETDEPCQDATECCGYEGTANTGDALCAGFGQDYRCTNICRADDDCAGDCCVALIGNTDYGMCGSCEGLGFGSDEALCYEGVAMLCDCLEGTDEACTATERAAFEAECLDPDTEIGQAFVCMGGASTCGEAAQTCLPQE